jgi:hypothetical protein
VSSRRERRTRRPRGGRPRGGAKERVCTACELKGKKGLYSTDLWSFEQREKWRKFFLKDKPQKKKFYLFS